jgi:LysM repeat protein
MTSLRIFLPSLTALALASCAPHRAANYDTPNPYGAANSGAAAPTEPANPVYDTPAAYEESGAPSNVATTASTPNATHAPTPKVPAPMAPRPPSNGAAIIHTVVAGDTLSGISAKYHVPVATIKSANNMTNDVVVLGRKMVIPPSR